MSDVYLYIDGTEIFALMNRMGASLSQSKFDMLMRRTFNDVGKRSKKIIRTAIMSEYQVKASFVNPAIKSAEITGGGGNITVRIPIIGAKGKIGGTFSAGGGFYGWNPPPYRNTASIVKSGISTLPGRMSSYGGQPPFRNIGERTTYKKNPKRKLKKPVVEKPGGLGGIVFTRKGKARFPIMPVAGLAVPQMPLNRARPETEKQIMDLAEKRTIHYFSRIFD